MNSEEVHALKAAVDAAKKAMDDAQNAVPVASGMNHPKYLEYRRLYSEYGKACIALSRARYEMRHASA